MCDLSWSKFTYLCLCCVILISPIDLRKRDQCNHCNVLNTREMKSILRDDRIHQAFKPIYESKIIESRLLWVCAGVRMHMCACMCVCIHVCVCCMVTSAKTHHYINTQLHAHKQACTNIHVHTNNTQITLTHVHTNSTHKQYIHHKQCTQPHTQPHTHIQVCTFYQLLWYVATTYIVFRKKKRSQEDTLVTEPFITT